MANQVQKIREHSDVSQWKYVKTENPTDFASRGLEIK